MTHAEFVSAYQSGAIRVHVDKVAAGQFVSARLLLPLVRLPVLGLGTAIALTYSVWIGLTIIGVATLAPMLIKRSAPHFVITQALQDAAFYDDVAASGLLEIVEQNV
ncbi:MAG: hypothetical protein ACXW16_08015 [Burkholderiaceae bacterium]